MYSVIKHLHSGLRWIVLALLVWAIYDAYTKWKTNTAFDKASRKPSFLAFNFTHIQVLIGLIVYFITPRINFSAGLMKDQVMRFFAVEHPMMMMIAVILITLGYIKGKKSNSFKTIFWYYLIALIIIMAGIPWPFMASYNSSWF